MAEESDRDLSWIVYTSVATTRFDDDRLSALLTTSRAANICDGVSGLLLYREQRFLQALEGPTKVVWNLFGRIADDPRHHDVALVIDEPIRGRRFPSWSMGYRPWSTPDGALPVGFRQTFDGLETILRPEQTVQEVRELFEWFRYNPLASAPA